MENLEYLLEENDKLNSKIKKATGKLRDWFKEKINTIKDTMSSLKEKMRKLVLNMKGKTFKKDVPDYNVKKGDSTEKVASQLKKNIEETGELLNNSLDECKEGMDLLAKNEANKASKKKELVIKYFRKASYLIIGFGLLGSAINHASTKETDK